MVGSAFGAVPLADVQWFLAAVVSAGGADLAGWVPAVDDRKLAPVPLGLVFEHRAELSPTRVEYAPVETGFCRLPVGKVTARMLRVRLRRAPSGQVFDRKVFDDHRLVLADESGRELVEEVASTVLDLGVRFGDLQTGFTIVVASFLLSGESLLGLFKLLLVTVELAWVGDFLPGAEGGEVFGAQIDADLVWGGG